MHFWGYSVLQEWIVKGMGNDWLCISAFTGQ